MKTIELEVNLDNSQVEGTVTASFDIDEVVDGIVESLGEDEIFDFIQELEQTYGQESLCKKLAKYFQEIMEKNYG